MGAPIWLLLVVAVSGSLVAGTWIENPNLEEWLEGWTVNDEFRGRSETDKCVDEDVVEQERTEMDEWMTEDEDLHERSESSDDCKGSDEWQDVVLCRMIQTAKIRAKTKKKDKYTAKEITYLMLDDGAFKDLKDRYGFQSDSSQAYMRHGERLATLLLKYDYGKVQQTDVSLEQIQRGFKYIIYNATHNKDKNRWGHVMGIPLAIYPSALLAKGVIQEQTLNNYLDRYWENTAIGAVWNTSAQDGYMSGGNLGSRAIVSEVEGVLRGAGFREERHNSVRNELDRDLARMEPYFGNGLRPDGCLHQHNMLPFTDEKTHKEYLDHRLYLIYNGSYGREMLQTVSQLFEWYASTSHQYGKDTVKELLRAFFECHQWLFRHKTFEPTSCGRHITSGKLITSWAANYGVYKVAQMLQKVDLTLLDLTTDQQQEYQQTLENIQLRFKTNTDKRPDNPLYALHGHKHFFNSDLTAHHRAGYMATVRVLSYRTCRPETWAKHNFRGYYEADGWVTVYVDGKEYGEPNTEVFLVYDWNLIPGVTNIYISDDNNFPKYIKGERLADHFYNQAKFVGGVTDGEVGVTTMDYDRRNVIITALKSFFFFDDVVVVVETRIKRREEHLSTPVERVQTTIAQMAFNETKKATIGPKETEQTISLHQERTVMTPAYLHHQDIGYVFLKGAAKVVVGAKSIANPKVTGGFIHMFTAVVDHEKLTQPTSLIYAIYPKTTLQQTKTMADDSNIHIMVDTDDMHVVCHKNKDNSAYTIGAVMSTASQTWTQPCFQSKTFGLWSSEPILALLKIDHSKSQLSLWLADPTQLLQNLSYKLYYDGQLKKEGEENLPTGNFAGKTGQEILVTV